ncbi:hypothetical protein CBR_g66753 [Chara braunii]|uniref:Dilute domain-containing protein n=1 Tax=Chara braunii TaxID=69332 RepID=A0A388JQ88_CHABU|nr:hypothetical protein CBR_g66753 [Chara braunii]|eukprot:GBG59947.1 hypothetical protein CBR_g66753 [Chara braunii]
MHVVAMMAYYAVPIIKRSLVDPSSADDTRVSNSKYREDQALHDIAQREPTAAPGSIEFAVKYEQMLQQAVEHIRKSQDAMIASENTHRRPSNFQYLPEDSPVPEAKPVDQKKSKMMPDKLQVPPAAALVSCHVSRPRQQATSADHVSRPHQQTTSAGHVSSRECHVSRSPAWSMLTRSQTAVMHQKSGETDEAYQARMLLLITEAKQRSDAVAAAAKRKAEDAEKARLLVIEQQRQQDEAAAKAADEERIQRREKICSGERALLTMAADWRAEAENGKMKESENKIALLLSDLTDLLATCITHQEDIDSLDDALSQVHSRLHQLEQRPVAALDARSSNTSDRLEALEIDVGSLKDGVQLQQTSSQQEAIAMDITGSFPKHKAVVDGILTVVDRLAKFAMFLPCRYHAKAPELAETESMETYCQVGGYGERLEFASLGLVGVIDDLASRARTDVGFNAGKERGPVEVTRDIVKGFRETEVSDSLGIVVFSQNLGRETMDRRDAKAASSFGVDVEEMVDEGIVRDSVKVAEFGVGRGEVGAGGVTMDGAMLERLGKVDMRHGSEDFFIGLVIGSAREGIDNTIGLGGSMEDGEGKMGEKVQPAGRTRGNILFGEDTGDDGVVGANGKVLAIESDQEALFDCLMQDVGFSKDHPVAAVIIFKCLLQWHSFEAERTNVFDRIINAIQTAIESHSDNNDVLAYWLSNTSTLLHLLQRTLKAGGGGGTTPQRRRQTTLFGRMTQRFSSQQQNYPNGTGPIGLDNVRQVEAKYPALLFKQQLTAYVEKIYGMLRDNLKKEITPLLGSCIQVCRGLLTE